nr:short integuments 2, mitochondrial [Quercus suber]
MAFNVGAHDTLHQRPPQIVVEVCIPFSSASHHLQPQLSSKQLVVALNQDYGLEIEIGFQRQWWWRKTSVHKEKMKCATVVPLPGVTQDIAGYKNAHQPSIYVLETPDVLVPSIPDIETELKLALAGEAPLLHPFKHIDSHISISTKIEENSSNLLRSPTSSLQMESGSCLIMRLNDRSRYLKCFKLPIEHGNTSKDEFFRSSTRKYLNLEQHVSSDKLLQQG